VKLLLTLITTLFYLIPTEALQSSALEFNNEVFNAVRRDAEMSVTATDSNVTISIIPTPRSPAVQAEITAGKFADILIESVMVTKSREQVVKDESIQATLKVSGLPNPTASNGYTIRMETLLQRLNLAYLSTFFINFQMLSVDPTSPTQLLFYNINDSASLLRQWIRLPIGVLLSQSWTTDQIIQVADSLGSRKATSKTFTINIPSSSFTNLPNGTYWFTYIFTMDPFITPTTTELIEETGTILQIQINAFTTLITEGNAILSEQNLLHPLTPSESAQVTTNINTINSLLSELQKEYTAFYSDLAKEPTTTASEKALITEVVNRLNSSIAGN